MAKAMAGQESEDVQRWTTKRKATLVISIIKETGIREATRQRGQTVAQFGGARNEGIRFQRTH